MSKKQESITVFEMLMIGLSSRLSIPTDILLLITKYYTMLYDLPTNLFIIQHYVSTIHRLQTFNIAKGIELKQAYNGLKSKLRIPPDTTTSNSTMGSICIINNQSLPISTQIECIKDSLFDDKLSYSCNWSMILKIGHYCQINAFHRELLTDDHEYGRCKFQLPHFNLSYYSTLIYNDIQRKLYAINSQTGNKILNTTIYSLDFEDKNWKWKAISSLQISPRINVSGCMINTDDTSYIVLCMVAIVMMDIQL